MFENLKETAKFDYKDSYEMTDKIEEELVLWYWRDFYINL